MKNKSKYKLKNKNKSKNITHNKIQNKTKSEIETKSNIKTENKNKLLNEELNESVTITKTKKYSSVDWDRVKGTIFVVVFVGCCLGFVVFSALGKYLTGGICFIAGVLSWFVAALFAYIDNKKWKKKRSKERYIKQTALVVDCTIATEKDVKDDFMLDADLTIRKYKIIGNYNNKKLTLYSSKPFKPGDSITIMVNPSVPLGWPRSVVIWE